MSTLDENPHTGRMVDPTRIGRFEKAEMVFGHLVHTPMQTFEATKKNDHGTAAREVIPFLVLCWL